MKLTYNLHLRETVVLLCSVFASSAFATSLTLNSNAFSNGNGLGGGEFTVISGTLSNAAYSPLAIAGLGGIETFSLEYGEPLTLGGVYDYTLSHAAIGGSGGAVGGSDPISIGTAWLYAQFATGTLANFNYGANRAASDNDLQLAFWFLEDETQVIGGPYTTYGAGSGNVFLNAAITQFGSVAGAKANAGGAYGVSVLNLTSGTVQNQSQLFFGVPDGGITAALLGLSLAGLVAFKRRTFSK